ncbi:MAG TPA: hypothetical protein VGD96_21155 [Bradyrhizobium sp.]
MASQNAVKRVQNTRLAATRSSLTISLTIPWATLDMADEAGGFKVILLSHGFVPATFCAGRRAWIAIRATFGAFVPSDTCRKFSQIAGFA